MFARWMFDEGLGLHRFLLSVPHLLLHMRLLFDPFLFSRAMYIFCNVDLLYRQGHHESH